MRRLGIGDERGVTLVELLIAASISTVAAVIFMGALASVQRTLNQQQSRTIANQNVRLAVEQLDREVRSGSLLYNPASESPANYSLRIYSPASAANRCIQWRIDDKRLRRRTWIASFGGTPDPATVSAWNTVADNVINREISPQQPAFSIPGTAAAVGRTLRVVLLTNTRASDHPRGTASVETSLTGRNTTRGSATVDNACNPAPAG